MKNNEENIELSLEKQVIYLHGVIDALKLVLESVLNAEIGD